MEILRRKTDDETAKDENAKPEYLIGTERLVPVQVL
jgi:hypothetical protein